jgi:hypothetical protein
VAEYPLIAGQMASWAEIGITLSVYGGLTFSTADFAGIDWDDALDPGKVYGTGGRMIGRTTGQYDANASMSMYLAKAREFQKALAQIQPNKIGLVVFDAQVAWVPQTGDGEVITCTLVGCRLAGRSQSNANGTDASVIEMPLSVARIDPGQGMRLI